MDWYNGLPEFTIEDSHDAVEFLFHGRPNIGYLHHLFSVSIEAKRYITNCANILLVQTDFEEYYKNFILKSFSYAGEDIGIINLESVVYNGFILGKLSEIEDFSDDIKDLLIPFNQISIAFNNIKNQDTLDFLRVILKNSFYKENRDKLKLGGSITIPILPQYSHEGLNKFIYLMSEML